MASTMTNYISPKDTIHHISPKDTMSSTSSCDYTEISISSTITTVWWLAAPCSNINCLRCKRPNPLQSPKGEEASNGSIINDNHETKQPNPLLQSPKGETTASNGSINSCDYTELSTSSSKPNPLLQPSHQSASNGNSIIINHTHTHAHTHTHTHETTTYNHYKTPNPLLSNPLVFDSATESDPEDEEEDTGYTSEDSDTSTIKAPIQITKTPLYHYYAAINAAKHKKVKSVKKQKAQVVQMMMMKEVLEREGVTETNGRMNLKTRFLEMARRELGLKTETEIETKVVKKKHYRWGGVLACERS